MMTGDLEKLGEEVDQSVDSISKVQTQILNRTHGAVNIFDANGEFRDYYDIMRDISEIYDELGSKDRASLTEILFGKNRGNQGAALIQAFQSGQVEKALAATLEAEGSAMQEQERWLESIEAKLGQLSAAWQTLFNDFLSSGIIKFGVDALRTLTNVLDEFIKLTGGGLGTVAASAGIGLLIKNFGKLFARHGCKSVEA